jgi:hypothetical protein
MKNRKIEIWLMVKISSCVEHQPLLFLLLQSQNCSKTHPRHKGLVNRMSIFEQHSGIQPSIYQELSMATMAGTAPRADVLFIREYWGKYFTLSQTSC